MSSEKLDRYKALYSKYIEYAVIVHNYHNAFLKTLSKEKGVVVRTSLREMINIEKELQKLSLAVYKENNENLKELRRANRQGFTKTKHTGPGRPKKNKNNELGVSK